MVNIKLLNKLKEAEDVSEEKLYTKVIKVKDLTILKVRDYLIIDASIVSEDLKNQIYTAYYRTGFMKLKREIVGILLEKDTLTIVSTSKEIVDKIAIELQSHSTMKKSIKIKKYLFSFILLVLVAIALLSTFAVKPAMQMTNDYNIAIVQFNEVAKDYNQEVVKVVVDNIEGVPGEIDLLLEVKEDYFSVLLSVLKGNSSTKIKKDINTINEMITTLNEGKVIIDNIYKPTSLEVESRLKNIEEIDKIKSVTEDNDPNGLLNKSQGYISCVYFTIDGLTIDGIDSDDPVVLGTNGGGCIEVYSTAQDAISRCNYLAEFDNTILYSGSYAAVGTMVIRTSYVLTEQQQYTLTNYIVQEFTKK